MTKEIATLQAPVDPPVVSHSLEGKHLIFSLGNEEFGIPVMSVREITGRQEITGIPQMPAYMKGMINLRGRVIPLIDLRLKLGMPESEYTARTCILVVEPREGSVCTVMGLVVDRVVEVVNLVADDIEDVPGMGTTETAAYLLALAKTKEGKVRILLDIDKLLLSNELKSLVAAIRGTLEVQNVVGVETTKWEPK